MAVQRLPLGCLLLGCMLLAGPWRVMDTDTLSRLAVGRQIAQSGTVPTSDPFTYAAPEVRWINPEWAGDLLWYGAHQLGGEPALVALGLGLAALGLMLTLLWVTRGGASPVLAVALLLATLPAVADLLHARNYLHAYWLIPLYIVILQRGGRWLWLLLPAAVLWANLHSSFVLGWVLLAAALARRILIPDGSWGQRLRARPVPLLLGLLALHPLLAMAGPHGAGVYGQLWDHLHNAEIYRQWVLEWRPPHEARGLLAQIPLHLMGVFGLISFLPRCNRRRLGAVLRVVTALALAYSSCRFLGLLMVLAAPDVAINMGRWIGGSPRPLARHAPALLLLVGLGLAGAAIHQTRTSQRPPLLQRPTAPVAAARFLAHHAPPGSRLLNPYNAGPYLLWLSPGTRLFIDPRNNLGAHHVKRYVDHVLLGPGQFEGEVARTGTTLAMVDLTDARYSVIARHLHRFSRSWQLVHMDGCFAVYARKQGGAARQLRRQAYLVVEGTLELEYLLQHHVVAIRHDLSRVRAASPHFAAAVEGYMLLSASSGPPPLLVNPPRKLRGELERGRTLLSGALPHLPPSPALMTYLATASARLGQLKASLEVLGVARRLFPGSVHVLALQLELAQAQNKTAEARALVAQMRRLGHTRHPVWQILSARKKQTP